MKKSPMHSTRAVRKKPARQQGFLGDYVGNVKAVVDMAGYVKAVCKDWFINGTTFALQAFARPVSFTKKFPDCLVARGLLLWLAAGGVPGTRCDKCKGDVVMSAESEGKDRGVRWCWVCAKHGWLP